MSIASHYSGEGAAEQRMRDAQEIERLRTEVEQLRDDQMFYVQKHDAALSGFRRKEDGDWCCNAHLYKSQRDALQLRVDAVKAVITEVKRHTPARHWEWATVRIRAIDAALSGGDA